MWLLIGSLIQLFAMHPLDLPGDSPVIATLGVRWFKGISALRQSDCQMFVQRLQTCYRHLCKVVLITVGAELARAILLLL